MNKKTSIFASPKNRGVEQLVARWAHNPKVVGSSPAPATIKPFKYKNLEGFFYYPLFSSLFCRKFL